MVLLLILACTAAATSLGRIYDEEGIDVSLLLDFERSLVSPSGKYVMECVRSDTETSRAAKFIVYSNDEVREEMHEAKRLVYLRFSNFIFWDPNPEVSRIWVYDGDTGTYFVQEMNGEWMYYSFYEASEFERYPEEIDYPELLKSLRPRIFK